MFENVFNTKSCDKKHNLYMKSYNEGKKLFWQFSKMNFFDNFQKLTFGKWKIKMESFLTDFI